MTPTEQPRVFIAKPEQRQKNLERSAETTIIPALLYRDSDHYDHGLVFVRGKFFAGVLTLEDGRRIADTIHDLIDAAETEARNG